MVFLDDTEFHIQMDVCFVRLTAFCVTNGLCSWFVNLGSDGWSFGIHDKSIRSLGRRG